MIQLFLRCVICYSNVFFVIINQIRVELLKNDKKNCSWVV